MKNMKNISKLIPLFSILLIFIPIIVINPRVFSYNGMRILFNLATPITLATMAQMFAIVLGDIDFSLGNYIGLCACVTATIFPVSPVLAILIFIVLLLFYSGIGVIIYLKQLPAIVVTIGMSFIWTGIAVTIQPVPGGHAPEWLSAIMSYRAPFVPTPLLFSFLVGLIFYLFLFKTKTGLIIRGIGGNVKSISHSGWSISLYRMLAYMMIGFLGILSGFALVGITTSADANISNNYTLLAVAGVIIGGGSFVGGKVNPIGAVLGSMTMTLICTLLSFLRVAPQWQAGGQGVMIILVLFCSRIMQYRKEK